MVTDVHCITILLAFVLARNTISRSVATCLPAARVASSARAMKPGAVALAVSKVGAGGTARLLTELMLAQDKKCTSVISLIEYLYTALLSSHVLLRRRQLPLSCHAQLLFTGVGASVLSNWAMESDVPVAIRLILKNGQLSANMAVGAVLLRRRYSAGQVAAISAITAGIILATAGDVRSSPHTAQYGVGVLCMVGALLLRASRGALQERAFGEHGICAAEVIFAQHMLGLPAFAMDPASLRATLGRWGELQHISLLGASVPLMWIYLTGEVCADHLHKLLTTRLVGETSALSSTLVSTIQRFVAIIVSACCVAPTPVPRLVWAGIALAACGCVVYALSEAPQPRKATKMKSG